MSPTRWPGWPSAIARSALVCRRRVHHQPPLVPAIAEALKARGLRIPFECISRADRVDEAVADALAEMGCYRLWIGAESGSQRILDAMERKATSPTCRRQPDCCRRGGIQVGMFMMLGYDGEDVSDIEATVDHLKKSNPDVFLTTVAYPIKGTKYHEAVDDQRLLRAALGAAHRPRPGRGRPLLSRVLRPRHPLDGQRESPSIGCARPARATSPRMAQLAVNAQRPPRHAPHREPARHRQQHRSRRPRLAS